MRRFLSVPYTTNYSEEELLPTKVFLLSYQNYSSGLRPVNW